MTTAKRGRPTVLDADKKRDILTILAMGGTRRTAAEYVGCTRQTIRNTANRDPQFAARLQEIRRHWAAMRRDRDDLPGVADRRGAWRPIRNGRCSETPWRPGLMTWAEMREALVCFARIVASEVPEREVRSRILRRLFELADRTSLPRTRQEPSHAIA